jgi:hypothetical protein
MERRRVGRVKEFSDLYGGVADRKQRLRSPSQVAYRARKQKPFSVSG